ARARGAAGAAEKDTRSLRELAPEELARERDGYYNKELEAMHFITGTPDTVIPKIRTVLETLRPGQIFFWDGDGDQTHEDAMRSMRLMGEHVLPAVREIGKELGLESAFSVDPKTNRPFAPTPAPTPAST